MKKVLNMLIILIIILFSHSGYASEVTDNINFNDINDVLNQNNYFEDFDFEAKVNEIIKGETSDTQNLWQKILSFITGELSDNFKAIIFLIAFAVFCGLITNLQSSFNRTGTGEIAFISIYFLYIYILLHTFNTCYNLAKNTLQSEIAFIRAATPLYVSTVASTGHITTATGINSMFLLLIQICAVLIDKILFPLTYWIFLLSAVNSATNKIQITKIIALARQTINWILGFAMTIFVGALSLSGLKGASIDKLGVKTLKYTMGSFVPVVGRLLSDTVDTVISTASVLRNSIGIVSIIAIFILCIYPVLKLTIITWLYRLAAGVIEPLSDSRLSNIISNAASTIWLITTMLITVSIVMILAFGIIISLCSIFN